jgi:hypothetical protein
MKTIHIIDNGCERYTIKADCTCLGRQWDNIAEQVVVVKPEAEKNNVCAMIVKHNDEVVDHIIVGDEPIDITSNLSQYASVDIGFSFSNVTGYIKNSEVRSFYFAEAIKPSDFVPMEPEQWTNVDLVLGGSIVRVELDGTALVYYNLAGQELSRADISGLVASKQDKVDISLTTTNKTIVGAINELNSKLGASAQTLQDILGV